MSGDEERLARAAFREHYRANLTDVRGQLTLLAAQAEVAIRMIELLINDVDRRALEDWEGPDET
jgi:hypothetical protein